MKNSAPSHKAVSAKTQLAGFMAKYSPEVARLGLQALRKMRKLLPGAFELIYDNYNALVVGFGSTEKAGSAPFSVVLYPRYVTLFFLRGVDLDDPEGILEGSGNAVRSIQMNAATDFDRPEVLAMIRQALKRAGDPFPPTPAGKMIVKAVSAKQRPRLPRSKQ